jgi:hypothetical protein
MQFKLNMSHGFLRRLAEISATWRTTRQANISVALVWQAADKIQLFLAVHGSLYDYLVKT